MNRTRTSLFFLLLSALVLFPVSVHAQEEHGWYAGGALGLSNYRVGSFDDDVNLSNERVDFEETVVAYRAYGGRRVNRNLGFELALTDYGQADGPLSEGLADSGDEFDLHERGVATYVTGFLPLGNLFLPELEHVELFGKTGPAWVHQDVKIDATNNAGNPVLVDRDENGVGVGLGIGLNLYVTERLAIRGELESIVSDATELDENMGTDRFIGFIGVQYNFHALPAPGPRR